MIKTIALGALSSLLLQAPVAFAAEYTTLNRQVSPSRYYTGPVRYDTTGLRYHVLPTSHNDATPGTGVHPYDLRERRLRERQNLNPYVSDRTLDFSPYRSQTHALHPLHRENYYSQFEYNYALGYGRSRLNYVPDTTGKAPENCDNYTYQRPNHRVPPFGYSCQK